MSGESLRDALGTFAAGWKDDLSSDWANVLNGVELDLASVPPNLRLREDEVIFPARKGSPHPDAPPGAHVFKALDRLKPEDVRAVIVGQDPYPRVSRATGRAFEQGDIVNWAKNVTKSMKSLVLTLATERSGAAKYFRPSAWPLLQLDLASGDLKLPPSARALFDGWENQGVLLLNAGLTLSHFEAGKSPEQMAHIAFWSPLIRRILQHLAGRNNRQVVFLAWGRDAQGVVKDSGVTTFATWNVSAGMSEHPHPAATTFWTPPNPLHKANRLLQSLGGGSVAW